MQPLKAARLPFALGLFVLGCLMLVPRETLQANGGTLRLSRSLAGPFALTVFTAPTPLRVGPGDVSVAVERSDTGDLEPNARVVVFAAPVGSAAPPEAYEASHERATDPSFYAADVPIPSPGPWRFEILVLTSSEEGRSAFEVDVAPLPEPLDTRLGLLTAVAAMLAITLGVRGLLRARAFRRPNGK